MSTLIRQIFYQPVGEVDVGGAGFGGGVLFEEVADFEVEVWEVGGAAEPVVVGVDVGEGYDLAAFEGCEAVVELGLASGGEPEVLGH